MKVDYHVTRENINKKIKNIALVFLLSFLSWPMIKFPWKLMRTKTHFISNHKSGLSYQSRCGTNVFNFIYNFHLKCIFFCVYLDRQVCLIFSANWQHWFIEIIQKLHIESFGRVRFQYSVTDGLKRTASTSVIFS